MSLPKKDKQVISVENVNGDVNAVNIKKLEINITSNFLEAKSFEAKDKNSWENEELVLSVEDKEMVRQIVKEEEEIHETLPILYGYKLLFDLLSKVQRGLLITIIQRISRENKLTRKLYKVTGEVITDLDTEAIALLNDEEEYETYGKIFSPDIHEDYKKIYNIVRSNDLERVVIPFIKKLKSKITNPEEFQEAFDKFWESRLAEHPYAIFVNSRQDKWTFEILRKFDNKEKENVRVYAKGEGNIFYTEYICKQISKGTGRRIKEIKRYHLGSANAVEIIFSN